MSIEETNNYRICTQCDIPHFENCGTCFGFGVYSVKGREGELFPVAAIEALQTKQYRGEVQACPECGSTTSGCLQILTVEDILRVLESAPRLGGESDIPEGTRFIQLSATLAEVLAKSIRYHSLPKTVIALDMPHK